MNTAGSFDVLIELTSNGDSRALHVLCICSRSSARVSQTCIEKGLPQLLKAYLHARSSSPGDALSACQILDACAECNNGAASLKLLLEEGLAEPLLRLLGQALHDNEWAWNMRNELVQIIAKVCWKASVVCMEKRTQSDYVFHPDCLQILQLPFALPSSSNQSMKAYHEVLESEHAVQLFTEALATVDQSTLSLPMSLLTRLVLLSPKFAEQYDSSGGLSPTVVAKLLDAENNPSALLVDVLLTLSQLARLAKEYYPRLDSAHTCEQLVHLLRHEEASVRARACNVIGNMCRHSDYFYAKLRREGIIAELVKRCSDDDKSTRKFACFALGNAGFHTDTLYRDIKAAVPVLTNALSDDDAKTRANAAGALGNLVRNSDDLCENLTKAGAVEALARIVCEYAKRLESRVDENVNAQKADKSSELSSPVKIALFSLGNLCTHAMCRERLEQCIDISSIANTLKQKSNDTAVHRYAARIESKLKESMNVDPT